MAQVIFAQRPGRGLIALPFAEALIAQGLHSAIAFVFSDIRPALPAGIAVQNLLPQRAQTSVS